MKYYAIEWRGFVRFYYPTICDNKRLRADFRKLDLFQIIIDNKINHICIFQNATLDEFIAMLVIDENDAPFAVLCGLALQELSEDTSYIECRPNILFEE